MNHGFSKHRAFKRCPQCDWINHFNVVLDQETPRCGSCGVFALKEVELEVKDWWFRYQRRAANYQALYNRKGNWWYHMLDWLRGFWKKTWTFSL